MSFSEEKKSGVTTVVNGSKGRLGHCLSIHVRVLESDGPVNLGNIGHQVTDSWPSVQDSPGPDGLQSVGPSLGPED